MDEKKETSTSTTDIHPQETTSSSDSSSALKKEEKEDSLPAEKTETAPLNKGKAKGKKKKEKLPLTPKQEKKRAILTTSIVVAVSVVVGAAGGYVLFHWLNPERTVLSSGGSEGVVPTKEEIEKSLSSNTLEQDYQPYQLVNYSLHAQASFPYALTLCKGAAVSMGVSQNIQSATYSTPKVVFNQNISSSSVVHTADRYYDYLDGTVHSYKGSTAKDWASAEDVSYTYDDFFQKNGKLFQGSYYCTSDTSSLSEERPVSDRYLTSDKTVYEQSEEKTKHHICGVVIYLIGPSTVKSSTLTKTSSGYEVTIDLYTDSDVSQNTDTTKRIASGCSYYSVQMRTTGGLASRPPFTSSHLVFTLDSSFYLTSSVFTDAYSANIGFMSASMSQTLTQYYFHSDSETFDSVDVPVPEKGDEDFKGYDLFPAE